MNRCFVDRNCSRCGGVFIGPKIVYDIFNCHTMIIGQNPSPIENNQYLKGIAFQDVDDNFSCIIIDECIKDFTGIYLTNLAKCAVKGKPSDNDIKICIDNYLTDEIDFVGPQLIICLGRLAEKWVRPIVDTNKIDVLYYKHPGYFKRNNTEISEIIDYYADMVYNISEAEKRHQKLMGDNNE